MKIVTAAEMREIDRITSQRFGVPSLTLMENAGTAVAEFALSAFPKAASFGVICGKGNNGGDGFVAARKLAEAGKMVRVLLLGNATELRGDAAENFKRLVGKSKSPKAGRKPRKFQAKVAFPEVCQGLGSSGSGLAFDCDVLIDAVLGTGFRPPVSGAYAQAIAKMNASSAPIIAVDIPSGADADVMGDQSGAEQSGAVVRADSIVTFTALRPAHVFGNLTSGPIVIAAIGSPDDAIQSSLALNLITAKDIAQLFAPRSRNSNKGMYGHALVVGGSLGKAGAAAMAGFSALRTGAGLVTVATAKSTLPTVAGFHPELMTEPLEETEASTIALKAIQQVKQLAEKKTVLAIGPGISRHEQTSQLVRALVVERKTAIVLDADGLNAFEGRADDLSRRGDHASPQANPALVLTPHPGEMSRLTGMTITAIQHDRLNVAREFAKQHRVILVLKGDRTIIAGPDGECWVNPTGNPGMATGGTGDILTGIVAGMIAQFPGRAFQAVIASVYLHGLAGDLACETTGEQALVATDLIRTLPTAIRQIQQQADEKWATIGEQGTKGH
jgi:hydroxyethylthiazole kinase-like uncharacterized protein yjeF